MKKLSLFITAVLLFFVSGCEFKNVPKIDEYRWLMFSIQNTQTGEIVACGQNENVLSEDVKVLILICCAENGNLTFTDTTNSKTYTGTYKLSKKDSSSSIHKLQHL